MLTIRPLQESDIPQLVDINPNFVAYTVIEIERDGTPPLVGWRLREVPLAIPFQKGNAYDFDAAERENIRGRLQQSNTLLEVVEDALTKRLLGILDVEEEKWRRAAWVWNLMLDEQIRGRGIGRQLVERTIAWARGRKLRAILLETQSNNTPACHFYARMGFQLIGVNDLFYTNHDRERQEIALFWGYPLEY
jgi:ribosomal protein S18 acetylase RimI-like enzyme